MHIALLVAGLAQAAIPPPSQSAQVELAVTICNNDHALVQDVRRISLPTGRTRQNSPTSPPRSAPKP
jgi:hypothetical protein